MTKLDANPVGEGRGISDVVKKIAQQGEGWLLSLAHNLGKTARWSANEARMVGSSAKDAVATTSSITKTLVRRVRQQEPRDEDAPDNASFRMLEGIGGLVGKLYQVSRKGPQKLGKRLKTLVTAKHDEKSHPAAAAAEVSAPADDISGAAVETTDPAAEDTWAAIETTDPAEGEDIAPHRGKAATDEAATSAVGEIISRVGDKTSRSRS